MENNKSEGKCVSCGFLALYVPNSRVPTPKHFEVDESKRKTGKVEMVATPFILGEFPANLCCYMNKFILDDELPHDRSKDVIIEFIKKNRNCDSWYEYIPGFSPKEHLEMLKSAELEESRRRFEKKMEVDRRIFDKEIYKMTKEVTVILSILVLMFASLQLLVTIWPKFPGNLRNLLIEICDYIIRAFN